MCIEIAESLIVTHCRDLTVSRENMTFNEIAALENMLWARSAFATLDLVIVGLAAYIDIRVPALGIRGHGYAFAFGLAWLVAHGDMRYNTLGSLLSSPNDFVLVGAAVIGGFTSATFSVGGTTIATLPLGAGGYGLGSVVATITWE